MQRASAQADVLRGESVTAVGLDQPARMGFIPAQRAHLGVQQRVVVEPVMPADALAMRQDLARMGVLLGRHVAGLFEQRHVDHRRGVALRAGVAVPVPGAAEIAAFVDDANVGDAGFDQARRCRQTGETASDKREADVIGLGLARHDRQVGVVQVMGEALFDLQVLMVAVGAESLVALLEVLAPQALFVDVWSIQGPTPWFEGFACEPWIRLSPPSGRSSCRCWRR